MTEEQYTELKKLVQRSLENQVILEQKLIKILNEVGTAIDNTRILGRDHEEIMEDIKKIKRQLNA